jgi:transcriptional regulator with XRE-family HTH domain
VSEREEFGPALRRERERRGITLQEIAAQTKIGASLFAGLERNDVSRWPTGIYRRAFLRAYAKVVGLDGERLVEEFRRLFPEDGDEAGRSQARPEAPAPPDRAGAKEAWKPVHDDATSGDLRLHLDAGSRASASRKQQSGPVKAGTPLQFESSPDAADASPGGLRLHLDSTSAPGAASRSTGRWRHGLTKRLAFLAIDLALVAVAGILSLVVFGGPAVWPALAVSSCVVLVAAPVLVRTTPGTWLLGLARRATVQPMASEAARRRPVELRATVRRYRASSGTSNSSDSVQSRYGSVHAVPRGHRRAARRLGK